MLPEDELSEDHVFGRALGGRVVVTAHMTCNSQSGSAAEGDLQRPSTLINLLKAVRGLDASPVPGTFPSGRRVQFDFKDGSVYSPPTVDKAQDGTTVRIEGTPAEAEKAYNTWRARNPHINAPEFKDLPPEAITTVSYNTVNTNLVYPLQSAEIVAAKAALGACVLAYGPTFAAGDFAAVLRAIQKDPVNPQRNVAYSSYLDKLDTNIPIAAAQAGLAQTDIAGLPHLVPTAGETVHDVILVPFVGQQTLLFAHFASELIPPYGIIVSAQLPPLTPDIQPTLPILLRDGGARDQLEITDFTQVLLQPAIDSLRTAEDEDGPQLDD